MKHCILRYVWLIALLTVSAIAKAKPDLTADGQYRITSLRFTAGCVTDGQTAGQSNTPLYYKETAASSDADYWTLSEQESGTYTIRNVKTQQYVTYDGVREGDGRRYISMTSDPQGNESLWILQAVGSGLYTIRNAAHNDHLWDVRVNTLVVGTYSREGSSSDNQQFYLYDRQGQMVTERFEISDPLSDAANGLTIDGRKPAYDTTGSRYLLPMPLQTFGQQATVTLNYHLAEGYSELAVNGQPVVDGGQYTISSVAANRPLTITVSRMDGTTVSQRIYLTSLPVVSIYGSFGYNYSDGHIIVTEPTLQHELLNMKAKWRGGITNGNDKHKRNYHVKLKDAQGQKIDHKYMNMRSDNSWILEACQVDMSRIRNRIVTDLWNDYSTLPYYADREPKARTGTRGRFVELLLNGSYHGIYCLTEAMDRKQMKLAKYDSLTNTMHGQLWKSKDWSYAVFMGHNRDNNTYPRTSPVFFNNNNESWDQYYVKYPDIDDVRPTEWQALYDAVNFVCTSSDADFRAHVAEYFDLPLVIDYYLLLETTLSSDNHGKNMYFACYDRQESPMITFGVWDFDACMGQRWSDDYYHSTIMRPDQDYTTYITYNEHGDYNLMRRLRNTNANDFNQRVRQRYCELRQTWLATDSILNRFRRQLDEFRTAGADSREKARWSGDSDLAGHTLNFATEKSYIEDWVTRRMMYLDTNRFKISELMAINTVTTSKAPLSDKWYTTDGRPLNGKPTQKGIYIYGKRKIVIK